MAVALVPREDNAFANDNPPPARKRGPCPLSPAARDQQEASSRHPEAHLNGKTPEGWEQQPAKNAQKDKDARP
jgi:hypothetical protein